MTILLPVLAVAAVMAVTVVWCCCRLAGLLSCDEEAIQD
jgi:hypothetical protein